MNITITRQELLELWSGLSALSDLKGFRLGYAIVRTKAKLKLYEKHLGAPVGGYFFVYDPKNKMRFARSTG